MKRYCEIGEKELVVGLPAAGRVEFHQVNIFDYEPQQPFDIIFCRNVTIYFSQKTSRAVLERMHGWLAPDGYMFAGAAESPSQVSDRFRPVRIGRSFAYVKADGSAGRTASRSAATTVREAAMRAIERAAHRRSASASIVPRTTVPQTTVPQTSAPQTTAPQATGRKSGKTAPGSRRGPVAEKQSSARTPEPAPKSPEMPAVDAMELVSETARWLAVKDFEAAERSVRGALAIDPRNSGAQALLAQVLANRGELDEAERVCKAALAGDSLAPEAHFVMGCIHREMSLTDEALADFQRCVYLDGDNSLAYFAIAGIHRQMGRDREAQREYKNALLALSRRGERGEDVSGAITCWLPEGRVTASGDVAMEGQDAD